MLRRNDVTLKMKKSASLPRFCRGGSARTCKGWGLIESQLADSPHADALDSVEYNVLLRDTRMDLALFREENIALGTELTKLGQRYNEICGAMTVDFDGEENHVTDGEILKSMTVRSEKVPIGRSVNADSKTLKKSTNCSTKWLGSVIRLR